MDCDDILKNGIFDETFVIENSYRQRLFERYIYKQDFSTHDEAIAAGIKIGVPVYDIPIEIGGTFNRQQKDTWFSTHADHANDQSTSIELHQLMKREVNPNVVNAWLQCVIYTNLSSAYGLRLDMKPSGNLIVEAMISWRELPGTVSPVAPHVTGSIIVGGTNADNGTNQLLPLGSTILDGYRSTIITILRPDPHYDLYASLSTDRGAVTGFANGIVYQPETVVFQFDPNPANYGTPVTLAWQVSHADHVNITDIGNVPSTGHKIITAAPEGTKELRLTATNEQGGHFEDTASLTVLQRPVVTGIEFFGTTGGDNKDHNTNFTVRIDGADGQSVAFGNNATDEFPSNTAWVIRLGVSRYVNYDIIKSCTAVLGFAPQGGGPFHGPHDNWDSSFNVRLIWNDHHLDEIPLGSWQMSHEHRDETRSFSVPQH